MSEAPIGISGEARILARNPLGVIALFFVLVYGLAALVTAFASPFAHHERAPLICFLVLFPFVALGVFAWLVSAHSEKLFVPEDSRNDENYLTMQLSAAASLAAAAAKHPPNGSGSDIARIVEVVQQAALQKSTQADGWRNHILWVDDRPEDNVYERQAFEVMGLKFSLALSKDEALAAMGRQRFAAVISDMGRKEGPSESYPLLDAMRVERNQTPVFFYAGSNAPEHARETREHGGQGCANNAQELFRLVTNAVIGGVVNQTSNASATTHAAVRHP